VCGELQLKNVQPSLHHETIYRYIYRHKQSVASQPNDHEGLTQYLRIRHRKKYKDRSKPVKRELIPNRVSIDLRPAIVQTNTQVGHWEADTVIGKGHDGVLLTLVERCTKYVLIVKLGSKHARALAQAAVKALRKCGLPVKTITFDNGLEFACHEYIGQQLGATTYFAHPYHSWERGLNENTNGLIRQYIPKSCPISIIRPTDITWIQDQLNNRPRKTLGYQSPAEYARNELYALQM
jgi:IS30 family transposase